MGFLDRVATFFGFGRVEKQENKIENNVPNTPFAAPSMGRASVSEHDENIDVQMDFARQYYATLDRIADTNPSVSYALSNFDMANMPHQIYLPDGLSNRKKAEMHKHLTSVRDKWFLGGVNSLDAAMTRELMVKGAISIEAVINKTKTGIQIADNVPIEGLYFFREGNDFIPYQIPTKGLLGKNFTYNNQKGIKLLDNYIYVPVQRKMSSPYPIPPFLASIFTVKQHEELMKSMYSLAKRLGVGFISVMVNPEAGKEKFSPTSANDIQKTKAYQEREKTRVAKMIDAAYERIKKGLTGGIFVGVEGQHKVSVEGQMDAANSDKMLQIFNRLLYAALKQDPNLMGENHTVTETFGNVILKKFTEQIEHVLFAKAQVYKKLYQIELLYAGYGWQELSVEFSTLELGDAKKNAEARKLRIEALLLLLDKKLISRQMIANELGYDEPYISDEEWNKLLEENGIKQEEQSNNQSLKAEPTQSSFDNIINAYSYPYDIPKEYDGEYTERFAVSDFKNKAMNRFATSYINSLNKQYDKFIASAKKKAVKELKGVKNLTSAKLQSILIGIAVEEFDKNFSKKISSTIKANVYDAYSFFRSDKSIYPKKARSKNTIIIEETIEAFDLPDSVFEQIDYRTMRYLQESDNLYLGRFITDEDTINRFRTRLAELYVENGAVDLGSDSEALNTLVEEFGSMLGLEAWKIRRIAETTLNNARSYASIQYMNQLEVTEYKRVEIADNLICPHCLSINGTVFKVSKAVSSIESIVSTDPETLPSFAVSRPIQEFRGMNADQMQDAGIGFGSLHPHCRGWNAPIM